MKKLYWSLLACLLYGTAVGQDFAKGTVYVDENGNGRQDRKEAGLQGVSVSNGREVVLTDKNRKYEFPLRYDNFIFVITPSGYALPLDQNNLPKFYYIHKLQGSTQLKYAGGAPAGPLPKALDFG